MRSAYILCCLVIYGLHTAYGYRKIVCEGEKSTIRCIAGQTLRIIRALYGRTDMTTCWSSNMVKSYCAADYSLYKVYDICNGRHSCELHATNVIFADPCANTTKYLDVEFFCEETGSICDGNTTTLICPDDGKLTIIDAAYGRQDNTICPDKRMVDTNCKARLSLDIVLHECENRKTCSLHASASSFGDPCPSTSKYLSVSYRCS